MFLMVDYGIRNYDMHQLSDAHGFVMLYLIIFVGIGHLVTEWDDEYGKPVGTEVSEDRVNELFDQDVQVTIDECKLLYNNFDELPEEAQQIIANMMFNMGRPRLSRFHKMKRAVDAGDWEEAGNQMKDSRWYDQVTTRAERLVKRMKAIQV